MRKLILSAALLFICGNSFAKQTKLLGCFSVKEYDTAGHFVVYYDDVRKRYFLTENLPKIPYHRLAWLNQAPVKLKDRIELREKGPKGHAYIYRTTVEETGLVPTWNIDVKLGGINAQLKGYDCQEPLP